jgi:hypothetical protein
MSNLYEISAGSLAVMQRQHANREILKLLSKIVEDPQNKDLRFHQILYGYNLIEFHKGSWVIVDKFNEESVTTLKKLEQCLNSMKSAEESETKS